jgi:hypothetical protein
VFYLGQLVLCVDDSTNPDFGPPPIRRGKVYTVSALAPPRGNDPQWGVEIVEAPSRAPHGYRGDRFRPIGATAVDVFRAELAPARAPTTPKPAEDRPRVADLVTALVES